MKKILFCLLACMTLAAVWYGCSKDEEELKGSIYGIVTTTGEPLKGINVSLYKESSMILSTITYDDGHYEFSDLTPGEYTMKVKTDGYQMHYASVLVEAERQARMDIQLKTGSPDNGVIVLQTDGIMVQQYDLSSGCSRNQIMDLYSKSDVGGYHDWRCPSSGEIKCLYEKRYIIGNFANATYWRGDYDYGWFFDGFRFVTGEEVCNQRGSYRLRAVRTLSY